MGFGSLRMGITSKNGNGNRIWAKYMLENGHWAKFGLGNEEEEEFILRGLTNWIYIAPSTDLYRLHPPYPLLQDPPLT